MPIIEPMFTPVQFVQQSVSTAINQRSPSVESVTQAARPIVSGIVEARGETVGVLTYNRRAELGGLEGAGLYTGIV